MTSMISPDGENMMLNREVDVSSVSLKFPALLKARRQLFNGLVQIVHVHADVSRFFSMKQKEDRCWPPNEIA